MSGGLAENSHPCSEPEPLQDSGITRHTKVPLMRVKPLCLENGCLGSVAANQEGDSDFDTLENLSAKEMAIKHPSLEEGFPKTGSKSSPGQIWTPKGMTEVSRTTADRYS